MKRRAVACFFVLIAVAACASGAARDSSAQAQLEVRIENNLIPPTSLDVFLVPRAGIERSLGNIVGSGNRRLYYRGLPLQGEYQLVARASSNRLVASSILVLDHVTVLEWDLMRNYIEIIGVDENR